MISQPMLRGPPLELITIELLYCLIVVTLCSVIFFRTRKIYSLSKHPGIYHFRNTFLYFALAYLFRFFHMGLKATRELIGFSPFLHATSLVIVGYLSTLAVLSLGLTVAHSIIRLKENTSLILIHTIAIISSLIVFFTRSHNVLMIIQVILLAATLAFIIVRAILAKKQSLSQNNITYFAVIMFWIASSLAFTPRFLPHYYKIPLYFLSAMVFVWIFIRVQKRLLNGKKRQT